MSITDNEDFKKELHKQYYDNPEVTGEALLRSVDFDLGAKAAETILTAQHDKEIGELVCWCMEKGFSEGPWFKTLEDFRNRNK